MWLLSLLVSVEAAESKEQVKEQKTDNLEHPAARQSITEP